MSMSEHRKEMSIGKYSCASFIPNGLKLLHAFVLRKFLLACFNTSHKTTGNIKRLYYFLSKHEKQSELTGKLRSHI